MEPSTTLELSWIPFSNCLDLERYVSADPNNLWLSVQTSQSPCPQGNGNQPTDSQIEWFVTLSLLKGGGKSTLFQVSVPPHYIESIEENKDTIRIVLRDPIKSSQSNTEIHTTLVLVSNPTGYKDKTCVVKEILFTLGDRTSECPQSLNPLVGSLRHTTTEVYPGSAHLLMAKYPSNPVFEGVKTDKLGCYWMKWADFIKATNGTSSTA